jgi:hypothetical protein
MTEPDNQKDQRRQKIADKHYKKPLVSEEQRFVSKTKKQMKRKMQDIQADELWEEWENEIS